MNNQPVKLLDQVRNKIRLKHYSIRTEKSYVSWIRRFILFHGKKHPIDMGRKEIESFLTDLAVKGKVSASTQNQAFNAILFLYKQVLKKDVFDEGVDSVRAKLPQRLPTVLSVEEVEAILDAMPGNYKLVGKLLYGCGLRGIECVRLRVKDADFGLNHILVRNGKGQKDRTTVLPESLKNKLREHLDAVREIYEQDREEGVAGVYLPGALEKKASSRGKEWGWFWVFPSKSLSVDPRSRVVRRHHVHSNTPQKYVRRAATQAGIIKRPSTHSGTALPRICLKTVTTSGPYRNSWGT